MGKRIVKEKIDEISVSTCDICGVDLEPEPPNNQTCDGFPIHWGNQIVIKEWAYKSLGTVNDILDMSICDVCTDKITKFIKENTKIKSQ